MYQTTKPSQEQLKAFLQHRQDDRQPPLSIDEIRRQLGWYLLGTASAQLRPAPL